jgi:hypothetical protein
MNYIVLVLKRSFHQQEFAAIDYQAIPVVEVWHDYQAGNAELILQRDEDESLGSARALPSDDTASAPDELPIFARQQLLRRQDSLSS